MNKKISLDRKVNYLLVSMGLVLFVIGSSYLVYAALTATDLRVNDFQIGQVETKINEVFDDTITEIYKNQSIKKKVTVKNTGTIKQFIRVMVLPEVQSAIPDAPQNKQAIPIDIGKNLILEQLNTVDWTYGGDGYYYYIKEAVKPLKNTEPLFDSIKLDNSLNQMYHQSVFTISLKAEAVNCAKYAYRDAWWQGVTPIDQTLKLIDENFKSLVES